MIRFKRCCDMRRVFLLLLPLTVIGIYWGASNPSWPPFVGEQPDKNLSIAEKNKLNEALVSELEAALKLPTGSSVKLQHCTLEIRILTGNACHSQAAHTQVKTLLSLREVERVSTLTKNLSTARIYWTFISYRPLSLLSMKASKS